MGVSNLTRKRLKNIKDSAVSDHLLQYNCSTDFDHFNILATDVSKFNLSLKESLLINDFVFQINFLLSRWLLTRKVQVYRVFSTGGWSFPLLPVAKYLLISPLKKIPPVESPPSYFHSFLI